MCNPRRDDIKKVFSFSLRGKSSSHMPSYAEIVKVTTTSPSRVIGWILEKGGEKGVRVAPWVIKKEKEALICNIVGVPKSDKKRLREVEL